MLFFFSRGELRARGIRQGPGGDVLGYGDLFSFGLLEEGGEGWDMTYCNKHQSDRS